MFFIRTFPYVKSLVDSQRAIASQAKAAGKPFNVWDNIGVISLVPYSTLGVLSNFVFAIMKIVDPNFHVGVSVIITILWFIHRSTFYIAGDFFQPHLIKSLLGKQQSDAQSIVEMNNRMNRIHLTVALIVPAAVLGPLCSTVDPFNPIVAWSSIGVYLLANSFSFMFYSVQSKFIAVKISQLLAGAQSGKVIRVRDRLVRIQTHLAKSAGGQALVYLVFGSLPFLWGSHDYLLPVSWMAIPVANHQLVLNLVEATRDPGLSSSMRSGTSPAIEDDDGFNFDSGASTPRGVQSSVAHHRRTEKPEASTAVGTMDATSVMEVDENNPELLATNDTWKMFSQERAKAKNDAM